MPVRFSRTTAAGMELEYIRQAIENGQIGADGPFTRRVEVYLRERLGSGMALLTHSCTAALEIAAILTVEPGDEVILPSFTFAGTATPFVRAGARPVFVDIQPDTLNIDPRAVEAAISARTKAIVAMHYAGVACDLDKLQKLAESGGVPLVEDVAHGFGAFYRGRPLGSFGSLAAFSFNHLKTVVSGEGGALL